MSNYTFHRWVRIAEVAVVVVLSAFALMTWLELNALRKAPVVLPNYQFEALKTAEGTPMVLTRGTFTTRCTKMPGVTIASGSSSPRATISCTDATVTVAAIAMIGPKLRAVLR